MVVEVLAFVFFFVFVGDNRRTPSPIRRNIVELKKVTIITVLPASSRVILDNLVVAGFPFSPIQRVWYG